MRTPVLTEVDQHDIHPEHRLALLVGDRMGEGEGSVADLVQCRGDFEHITESCQFDEVGVDMFDGEVAAVSGRGSAVRKEELAARHLTEVEIPRMVDDTSAVGIFVIDAYFQNRSFGV